MANRHYGKLGDLWKHIPLCEILSIETPVWYGESHAGDATYPLTRSDERDFGIFHLLDAVERAGETDDWIYTRYFKTTSREHFPGSPALAMDVLTDPSTQFVFCDLDQASLDNIRAFAMHDDRNVACIADDGVMTMDRWLRDASTSGAFVHLDPYLPGERASEDSLSSDELFFQLASRGIKVMLWYGFHASSSNETDERFRISRDARWQQINDAASDLEIDDLSLWCGEVFLRDMLRGPLPDDLGIHGCGVLCANLSDASIDRCRGAGEALVRWYDGATMSNGVAGDLVFEEIRLSETPAG